MIINNKDVLQSYILTTAKYDFSVMEKRILFRLIELQQFQFEGKEVKPGFEANKDLWGDHEISMPLAAFLNGEEDHNHTRVKKALEDLEKKRFTYEDDKVWQIMRIIQTPKIDKYSSIAKFRVDARIWDALFDFSKGFRKFELKTAMEFKSTYSMRFYELFSNQKSPLTFTIEHLKIMFGLEDKYIDRPADFIKYIVVTAQKELDEKAPYSFKYSTIKSGKKITAIKFYPLYIPANRDSRLEQRELEKQISLSWDLPTHVRNYLLQDLLYSEKELKPHLDLLKTCNQELDLLYELSILKGKSRGKKTAKGWIINALRGKLNDKLNKCTYYI